MRRFFLFALGLLLAFGLFSCAPQNAVLEPPKAQVAGYELLSIDPFQDRLSVRLDLELWNPNPVELPLLESELTARLGGWTTRAHLPALTLPKSGRTQVSVVLEGGVFEAGKTVADLLSGRELLVMLSGKLWVNAFGRRLALGPYTLVEDRVRFDLRFAPPKIRPLKAELRFGMGTLSFKVRFLAQNPLPVGYKLEGGLVARVGGHRLGEAPLSLDLPPRAEREGSVGISLSLASLGGVVHALRRPGTPYELVGRLEAVIPGIWERPLTIRIQGKLP